MEIKCCIQILQKLAIIVIIIDSLEAKIIKELNFNMETKIVF